MEREKKFYLSLPRAERNKKYTIELFKNLCEFLYKDNELLQGYFDNIFFNNMPQNETMLVSFIGKLQCFIVYLELKKHLYSNSLGSIDINDSEDINFLSVAIPYCDVVIGEKKWISVSKSLSLDKKYATKLERNGSA